LKNNKERKLNLEGRNQGTVSVEKKNKKNESTARLLVMYLIIYQTTKKKIMFIEDEVFVVIIPLKRNLTLPYSLLSC